VQAQLDKAMMALAMSHPPVPAQLLRSHMEDSDAPTLPPAMPELDLEDYPNACYWTDYKKKWTNQGFTVYGLNFMCDKDGAKIPDEQLSAMTKRAKQLWNTLYQYCQDPSLWGKKTDFEANFFCGICESVSPNLDSARAAGRLRCLPSSITLTGLLKFEIPVPFCVCFLHLSFKFLT
jgi:hypothetical protein